MAPELGASLGNQLVQDTIMQHQKTKVLGNRDSGTRTEQIQGLLLSDKDTNRITILTLSIKYPFER